MKFTNIRPSENGLTFDVEASNQETTWLINFAVETLLKEGILSINEFPPEQTVSLRETAH